MKKSLVFMLFTVITYPSIAQLDKTVNDLCCTNKFIIRTDLAQPFFTWLI